MTPSPPPNNYRGLFMGSMIWVTNVRDAGEIYRHGCFGKGILSKGLPNFRLSMKRMIQEGTAPLSTRKRQIQKFVLKEEARLTKQQAASNSGSGAAKKMKLEGEDKGGEKEHKEEEAEEYIPDDGGSSSDNDVEGGEEGGEAPLSNHANNSSSNTAKLAKARDVLQQLEVCGQVRNNYVAKKLNAEHEYLQLSLEEAFFLHYAIGCLDIVDQDSKELSAQECWRLFNEASESFLRNYVAYHYFRSKGWVARDGIKYGVDWVLYREGPEHYHSDLSVIVRWVDVSSSTTKDYREEGTQQRRWDLPLLSNLNRVSGQVVKDTMLLYVVRPEGVTEEDLGSHKVIERLAVQEVVFRRWIPEKERA